MANAAKSDILVTNFTVKSVVLKIFTFKTDFPKQTFNNKKDFNFKCFNVLNLNIINSIIF